MPDNITLISHFQTGALFLLILPDHHNLGSRHYLHFIRSLDKATSLKNIGRIKRPTVFPANINPVEVF